MSYATEGSIFVAGDAVKWLRDGLKIISTASEIERLAQLAKDDDATHVRAFQLPPQAKKLVIDSEAIIQLGNILAEAYLKSRK